jgi:hypothetical protein
MTATEACAQIAVSRQARRFLLIRRHDISGVTGTGVVAEGIRFSDQTVALRWYGAAPATAVGDSVDAFLAVHGDGTAIHWLDHPNLNTRQGLSENPASTEQSDLARAAASPSLAEPGSGHGADSPQSGHAPHAAHRP